MKTNFLFVLLMLFSVCYTQENCQYQVFFTNGNSVQGIIYEINIGENIKIEDNSGVIFTYSVNEVSKIRKSGIKNTDSNATDEKVPFVILDIPPVFPGCDSNRDKETLKKCTSEKISDFFYSNFNKDILNSFLGRQRISVNFVINSDGHIVEVSARASDLVLEKEAERIASLLPVFKPGVHQGKLVNTLYSQPLIFRN